MGLELLTPPAELPVSVVEAKLAATAESTEYDSAFEDIWIPAAVDQAELRLGGRAIIEQKWRVTLDSFKQTIRLPKSPLISVESIKYIDTDGILQTLANTEYQVKTDEVEGLVYPAYGKAWPSVRCEPGAIRIEFSAGFGAAADVPASIKNWILMAVATWYRQREGIITGTIVAQLPRDFFAALLDKYTIHRI